MIISNFPIHAILLVYLIIIVRILNTHDWLLTLIEIVIQMYFVFDCYLQLNMWLINLVQFSLVLNAVRLVLRSSRSPCSLYDITKKQMSCFNKSFPANWTLHSSADLCRYLDVYLDYNELDGVFSCRWNLLADKRLSTVIHSHRETQFESFCRNVSK